MSNYFKNFKTIKILHSRQYDSVILASSNILIPGMPSKFIIKKLFRRSVPQESTIHKKLFNKNSKLLEYYYDWYDPPFFYICLEYCEGGDLDEFLSSLNAKNFPFSSTLAWCKQISDTVSFLHSQQICHRDIKSLNIFITREGELKLGDFGDAKIVEKPQNESHKFIDFNSFSQQCKEKGFYGTLIKSSPYTDDIWALGKVFLEIAKGKSCPDLLSNQFVESNEVVEEISLLEFPLRFKELLCAMLCVNRKSIDLDSVISTIDQLLFDDSQLSSVISRSQLSFPGSMASKQIEISKESSLVHYELRSIHSDDLNLNNLENKLFDKSLLKDSSVEESYYSNEDRLASSESRIHSNPFQEKRSPEPSFRSSRASQIMQDLSAFSEKKRISIASSKENKKIESPLNGSVERSEDLKEHDSPVLVNYSTHKRSLSELVFKRTKCCVCDENIKESGILAQCNHHYHHYCFVKTYNEVLCNANKKIDLLKCVKCEDIIEFDTCCLCWLLTKDAYRNAYLQLFAHIRCICPSCSTTSDMNMLDDRLKFSTILCRVCETNYCSFCSTQGSHGWRSGWSCRYLRCLKQCNFIINN